MNLTDYPTSVTVICVVAFAALFIVLMLFGPWRGMPKAVANPYAETTQGGMVAHMAVPKSTDDATAAWRKAIQHNKCPDCGHEDFYNGPSGGMSQNIMCSNDKCCSAWNVAQFNGDVLTVERIPNYFWNPPISKDAYGKITT